MRPAQHPDITVTEAEVPKEWVVRMLRNGVPMDLTNTILFVPVTDNGIDLGELDVDRTDAIYGRLTLVVTEAIFAGLKRYGTWRLHEDTDFHTPLMQGRIVKEDG